MFPRSKKNYEKLFPVYIFAFPSTALDRATVELLMAAADFETYRAHFVADYNEALRVLVPSGGRWTTCETSH